ncbi:hypothetical protein G7085_14515 [Tessaracoccus sp. HDW20]|uniref:hypothetical protein n=1 Tax=Tessaracoccus coleopterorum TaxID=2714950 RepID=UPI0018D4AE05|nr:hypothetical protein [Tessaracoccus coleopterorum]NHB85421.1 hypothetical protein [Tessaracoccus coleopterorum]
MSRATIPADAVDWLAVWRASAASCWPGRLLARRLDRAGHHIFAMSEDPDVVGGLGGHPRITALHARPRPSRPTRSSSRWCSCTSGCTVSTSARPSPDRPRAASRWLPERVVPHPRRFRSVGPQARRSAAPLRPDGDEGRLRQRVARHAPGSRYFPEIEERAFRVWQSVSHEGLLNLVRSQPLAANLSQPQLDALLAQVSELFEGAVRPGESLRLPFQMTCLRAWVNHEELTGPVIVPENALAIPL